MMSTTKKAPAKKAAKAKTKPVKQQNAEPEAPAEKLSQIAAAEQVLADAGKPMTCGAMVEAMVAKGLWASPGGKTPAATLYASILRLIKAHGKDAKIQKVARGQFALAATKGGRA
jgi:hypothetical protein